MVVSMIGNDVVYLLPQQGLGDHLICIGIYNELSHKYQKVLLPVIRTYSATMSQMLSHLTNIEVISYRSDLLVASILNHSKLLQKRGIPTIALGVWPSIQNTFSDLQFDMQMYKQAGLDFDARWSSFRVSRNHEKEELLYRELDCGSEPYIFLHEDTKRGFLIDRGKVNPELKVVTPLNPNRYSILDYRLVIERAQEIHCIESSFAALIEGLLLNVKKFAHRYARPEVLNSPLRAFTYRSDWNIIL